jgi:phosphoribosyl-ATP pyrophosphohydrolase
VALHCGVCGPNWEDAAADRVSAMRPLDQLEATIRERQQAGQADKSYTARLLAGGVAKIGPKVTEEAAEVVEAAAEPEESGRQHTICEAADVIYHLMVLMAARGVTLDEIERELARRFGMSGLEEKASRGPSTQ